MWWQRAYQEGYEQAVLARRERFGDAVVHGTQDAAEQSHHWFFINYLIQSWNGLLLIAATVLHLAFVLVFFLAGAAVLLALWIKYWPVHWPLAVEWHGTPPGVSRWIDAAWQRVLRQLLRLLHFLLAIFWTILVYAWTQILVPTFAALAFAAHRIAEHVGRKMSDLHYLIGDYVHGPVAIEVRLFCWWITQLIYNYGLFVYMAIIICYMLFVITQLDQLFHRPEPIRYFSANTREASTSHRGLEIWVTNYPAPETFAPVQEPQTFWATETVTSTITTVLSAAPSESVGDWWATKSTGKARDTKDSDSIVYCPACRQLHCCGIH